MLEEIHNTLHMEFSTLDVDSPLKLLEEFLPNDSQFLSLECDG